ncbi:MAG: glucuronate isomerase [Zavarzinella sp.]
MTSSQLQQDLYSGLCEIPLIDPHSHIEPLSPVSSTIDDILGYHYYTELSHSAGMPQDYLAKDFPKAERVARLLEYLPRIDNTAQYSWFVEIAEVFLGLSKDQIGADNAATVFQTSVERFQHKDWEKTVFQKTNLEKIFLTNEFDDPLAGFDPQVYVPCLRTDSLVFQIGNPAVQERLAKATGITVENAQQLKQAITALFQHFLSKNAKACAISLPPDFAPVAVDDANFDRLFAQKSRTAEEERLLACAVFWKLAEACREFSLPFDLMIGVNRRVYENGVFQGQDLFDQRTSLLQYRALFNAFPTVKFPVSVLTSGQNQELVAYSWIFPNVIPNGHWWYSNIPAYIGRDLQERLQAVPKTKLIGYYSDAYKLEFVLPKFNMYRRILAQVLAENFVQTGNLNETQAIQLGKRLLRDNTREIFRI